MDMKVALISDTHGMLPAYPDADILIHAGDIALDRGQEKWFRTEFFSWVREFGNPVYATFGNHDFTQGAMGSMLREKAPPNLDFVVDEARLIGGKRFWFSPWSPRFGDWAWMAPDNSLAAKYEKIPLNTEVIVSHGPPKGAGDYTRIYGSQHVGSEALAERMSELTELELVITGHIHEDVGYHSLKGTRVINVSSVDGLYQPREKRFFYLEWDPEKLFESDLKKRIPDGQVSS